jgi:hypothetical protein
MRDDLLDQGIGADGADIDTLATMKQGFCQDFGLQNIYPDYGRFGFRLGEASVSNFTDRLSRPRQNSFRGVTGFRPRQVR